MVGIGEQRRNGAGSGRYGYVGLARRERGAVLSGVLVAMTALAALFLLLRPPIPRLPNVDAASLRVFDVPPPPPPPPPMATDVAPLRAADAGRPRGGSPGRERETPTKVALAPAPRLVDAPVTPLVRVDASLPASGASAFDRDGFGGLEGLGIDSGSGVGAGNGSGDGGGGADRYARAIWIAPPTRADFRREWPLGGDTVADPVDVLLVCLVTRAGRPHDCRVARDSRAGLGFGAAAIRLTEASRVRPVLKNGRRTDLPVIVPLRFKPR